MLVCKRKKKSLFAATTTIQAFNYSLLRPNFEFLVFNCMSWLQFAFLLPFQNKKLWLSTSQYDESLFSTKLNLWCNFIFVQFSFQIRYDSDHPTFQSRSNGWDKIFRRGISWSLVPMQGNVIPYINVSRLQYIYIVKQLKRSLKYLLLVWYLSWESLGIKSSLFHRDLTLLMLALSARLTSYEMEFWTYLSLVFFFLSLLFS